MKPARAIEVLVNMCADVCLWRSTNEEMEYIE